MPINYDVEYPKLNRKYVEECTMTEAQAVEITKLQKRITNLEAWNREMYENHKGKVKELEANCGFFKSCLLSGEIPKAGAEPYPE